MSAHPKPVKGGKPPLGVFKVRNLDIIYSILQKRKLIEEPNCQIKLVGCKGIADQVHHRAGKEGIRLIIYEWFFSACGPCHRAVTKDSKSAIEAGHSLNRGYKDVKAWFWWVKSNLEEYIESLNL